MHMALLLLLLLPVPGTTAAAAERPQSMARSPAMPLTILPAAEAKQRGAVCLDGSPPGLYFRPAAAPASNKSWVLFMKGGAWCSSPSDCAARSRSNLGSSTKFPPSYAVQGPLDPDPAKNPSFANFNHVVLFYCDGASFASNADLQLHWKDPRNPANNATLYFRGQRVLEYSLEWLMQNKGLDQATDILFGGGSAGGLATFLRADATHQFLLDRQVPVRRFRALPVSGFFLDHADESGQHAFADSMRETFELHNCSGGVPAACTAALSPSEHWRCFLANYSFAASRTPFFLLQSSLDLYQLFAILRMGGWQAGCLNCDAQFNGSSTQPACTPAQVLQLQQYSTDFLGTLRNSWPTVAGSGGFVDSCLGHQDAIGMTGGDWQRIVINGTSMQQALTDWWNDENVVEATGGPGGKHWHSPCMVMTNAPHQCNPSCIPAHDSSFF